MITKELANHINTVFNQSSKPIHPVSLPLPFVKPTVSPVVLPKPLPLVINKRTFIAVSVFP